jgi:hypothetical protein
VVVTRFTEDHEMTEAVISQVEEAWHPRELRVWRRRNAAQEWAVEAMIRTGPNSGYGGSGPTRGPTGGASAAREEPKAMSEYAARAY